MYDDSEGFSVDELQESVRLSRRKTEGEGRDVGVNPQGFFDPTRETRAKLKPLGDAARFASSSRWVSRNPCVRVFGRAEGGLTCDTCVHKTERVVVEQRPRGTTKHHRTLSCAFDAEAGVTGPIIGRGVEACARYQGEEEK